jgi:WD40 repeat protein
MASVSGENINIWKFYKGKMGPDKVLEGHTNYINCLLFSKYKNWLASAGDDNTIRLWKRSEEGEGEWISSQPSKGHEKSINCIIWCKQEE